MSELALFPLPVVLFPDSALPLHIFEERYRILIAECISHRFEFGINLVHEGKMSEIGCTAVVEKLVKKYDDGKMDIIVQGKQRYRLMQVKPESQSYMVGEVEYLGLECGSIDQTLAQETIRLHNTVIDMVYNDTNRHISIDSVATGVSFVLAQKSGMDLFQRQHLLEVTSENERLKLLSTYFTGIIPKLETMGEVNRVVRSDGYL